jgi:hypothetical protein
MSRSKRKAFHTLTNQIDKDKAHRRVRRMIKAELDKPEPELIKLDADTRDIGAEEWGTKFGFIFVDPDNKNQKDKEELERK